MADFPLRPELFDEPTPRSEEERNQSYGKEWLEKLYQELDDGVDEEEEGEDQPIETEDKFLPRRR